VDAHGTTTNNVVITYPGQWKTPAIFEKESEKAQWTRVNTIPKAVADATLRSQQ
jgi:hypothetical protein